MPTFTPPPPGLLQTARWLSRRLRPRRPPRAWLRSEFFSLPLERNAAILARLADDLLDTPHVRAEIDRWGNRMPGDRSTVQADMGRWGNRVPGHR